MAYCRDFLEEILRNFGLGQRVSVRYVFKNNSGIGIINTTTETHHLLTQILTIVSHFELGNGCQIEKCLYNLGHVWSLCRHFCASTHDGEASND